MAFAGARLLYSFGIKSVFCHARTANWILKDVKCVAYLRFNLPALQFGKQFVTTSISSNYNQQTQHELEKEWIEKFRETDIPDPEYSVKWISEHVERMLTSKTLQNADTVQKNYFEAEFIRLCKRRLKREPVQYVVGDWDFRFLNLKMKAPVFIPRPETEGLVELINQHVKLKFASSLCNILEIGCGTGAISLSLAYENAMVRCTTIDISQDAVSLATENCKRLGLTSRVNIHLCDVSKAFVFFHQEYLPRTLRPWQNNQTLLAKYLGIALQAVLDRKHLSTMFAMVINLTLLSAILRTYQQMIC